MWELLLLLLPGDTNGNISEREEMDRLFEEGLSSGEDGAAAAAAFIEALTGETVEAVDALIALHDGVPAPVSPLPLSPPAPPDDNAVDGCAAAPEPVVKRWVARAPSAAYIAAEAAQRARAVRASMKLVPAKLPPAKRARGCRGGRKRQEQQAAAAAVPVPRRTEPIREEARPRDPQPGGKGSKLSSALKVRLGFL
ncbi:Putative 3-oxopropanoate dehydrogenase [Frankliniella fusca]|uniref:3-oxopropanoate dehydrogenase n=1 Tax=Frankliniella fusca TaxID=407009 RepID=A0AAE1H6L4_9NEOP|nr:Putative 3-oxopropanoate dehydrogenase [Frankliniella fusca]